MALVDIRAAAAQKLDTGFPGFYLYYDGLPENFSKPCFLVQIVSASKANEIRFQFTRAVTVNIRYYPDEGVSIGLLEMQEELERLFDIVIPVGERAINIDRTKGELLEKVLDFTFDLDFTDSREELEEDFEMMQALEMKEEF